MFAATKDGVTKEETSGRKVIQAGHHTIAFVIKIAFDIQHRLIQTNFARRESTIRVLGRTPTVERNFVKECGVRAVRR